MGVFLNVKFAAITFSIIFVGLMNLSKDGWRIYVQNWGQNILGAIIARWCNTAWFDKSGVSLKLSIMKFHLIFKASNN